MVEVLRFDLKMFHNLRSCGRECEASYGKYNATRIYVHFWHKKSQCLNLKKRWLFFTQENNRCTESFAFQCGTFSASCSWTAVVKVQCWGSGWLWHCFLPSFIGHLQDKTQGHGWFSENVKQAKKLHIPLTSDVKPRTAAVLLMMVNVSNNSTNSAKMTSIQDHRHNFSIFIRPRQASF